MEKAIERTRMTLRTRIFFIANQKIPVKKRYSKNKDNTYEKNKKNYKCTNNKLIDNITPYEDNNNENWIKQLKVHEKSIIKNKLYKE